MNVARRVAGEYAIQVVGFLVTLADRLLIAGVLLRCWGVTDFALWSVLSAAAALLAFFDVGVSAYFSNKIMIHVQRGEVAEARRAQRDGNGILFTTTLIGVLVVLAGFGIYAMRTGSVTLSANVWITLACLALSTWLRLTIVIQAAVYRAHNEYGRGSLWLFGMDALRVAGTVAAVALGAGLLAVASFQMLLVVAVGLLIVLWDTRRRYPDFRFGMSLLPRAERGQAMLVSLGYWIQQAPNTVLTYAPVMFLSSLGGGGSLVAQFVLMRTIGNLVRQVLQQFALVLGQEAARRYARGELEALGTTFRESTRLLAVQAACATGAVVALGGPLFALWTGHPAIFDRTMLILAVLPPVLVPSGTLMQAFFGSINRSYPLAVMRVWQVALTVAALILLPLDSPGQRVMAAIGLGEVLGFAIPIAAVYGRRTIPGAGIGQLLDGVVRSLGLGLVTFAAVQTTAEALSTRPLVGVAIGMMVAGALMLIATLLFGMDRKRLPVLWQEARRLTTSIGS